MNSIKGASNGNKGVASLLLFKRALLDYLLESVVEKQSCSTHAKVVLRSVFASYDSYHAKLTPLPGMPEPDMSWQIAFSKSELEMLKLIEAVSSSVTCCEEWSS